LNTPLLLLRFPNGTASLKALFIYIFNVAYERSSLKHLILKGSSESCKQRRKKYTKREKNNHQLWVADINRLQKSEFGSFVMFRFFTVCFFFPRRVCLMHVLHKQWHFKTHYRSMTLTCPLIWETRSLKTQLYLALGLHTL